MYYLRKEPFEQTISEIRKTNGEVIPERKVMTDDAALYRGTDVSGWRGRDTYPAPRNKGVKLYTCKTLKQILKERTVLFNYCGEWYDVYDENGIVHGRWEQEATAGKTQDK